jgi:hypothetical protein
VFKKNLFCAIFDVADRQNRDFFRRRRSFAAAVLPSISGAPLSLSPTASQTKESSCDRGASFVLFFPKGDASKKMKQFLEDINKKIRGNSAQVTGFGPNGQECENFLSLVYRAGGCAKKFLLHENLQRD